jgi:hypothetical protein
MTKAKRQTIALGDLELDVFQLPDGGYVMSQSQVAGVVGLQATYALRFLSSKWLKALPGQGYTEHDFSQIEVDSSGQLQSKMGQYRLTHTLQHPEANYEQRDRRNFRGTADHHPPLGRLLERDRDVQALRS